MWQCSLEKGLITKALVDGILKLLEKYEKNIKVNDPNRNFYKLQAPDCDFICSVVVAPL